MARWMLVVALALAPSLAVAADEPAPADTEFHFGAGIFDSFIHRQGLVRYVFNDQHSTRITQSSSAKRVEAEWRVRQAFSLVGGFELPTRDELLRSGDTTLEDFHFPKSISLGAMWNAPNVFLTRRGWLEFSVGGGAEEGLSDSPLQDLLPYAEGNMRFALVSGTALQLGVRYAGIVSRGHFAMVLGVAQRI